jgi:hypothetical protein
MQSLIAKVEIKSIFLFYLGKWSECCFSGRISQAIRRNQVLLQEKTVIFGLWLERLTANAEVATVLSSIPASSDSLESEGRRQMKQF